MKNIFLLSLSIINLLFLYAQTPNTEILETGSLLFIQPAESCLVLVDGVEAGTSPLLLSEISSTNKILQLRGERSFAETKLQYDPEIQDVCHYSPKLGRYYGYLVLLCDQDSPELFIDDLPCHYEKEQPIRLDSGPHLLRIEKPGYLPEQQVIEIPRLEEITVNLSLRKAIPVRFTQPLPSGTQISFTNEETGIATVFSEQDRIFLSRGSWQGVIENRLFEKIEIPVTVEDEPLEITPDIRWYRPRLALVGLEEESIVFLNQTDVTDQLQDLTIEVPVGLNHLSVMKDTYLTIEKDFFAGGDETIRIVLEYEREPSHKRKNRLAAGGILLGSGISFLVGGIVLNNDNILPNITPSYDVYSTLKYTTLGVGGAGLVMSLTGVIVSLSSMKYRGQAAR